MCLCVGLCVSVCVYSLVMYVLWLWEAALSKMRLVMVRVMARAQCDSTYWDAIESHKSTHKQTHQTHTYAHTHAYTPWVMTEGSHLISVIRSGCIWDSITALSWVPSSSVRLYKALLPWKMPHLWSKSDYEDTHKFKEACTNRHTSASSKVRSKSDVPDSIPLDPSIR